MKTPMQELIENLEVFLGKGMSYSEWKKLTYGGKTSIEKYLDREKEVIETAFIEGFTDEMIDPINLNKYKELGELYYIEKFKLEQ